MIFGDRIAAGLPRILVPANEAPGLIRFAANFAKAQNAALLTLYVKARPAASGQRHSCDWHDAVNLADDPTAQAAFRSARTICADTGVPVLQIYAVHNSPGEMLLDHAATWGVDAMIMGASRTVAPPPVNCSPTLQKVYAELPSSIPLIIHT